VTELEKAIGYKFSNTALLDEALTHSSYVNGKTNSNERLEFLGDSVLSVVVSKYLFENLDMHAYRLAHGLDSRYNNTSPPDKFFSNFDYIKWAITKRGVCNIGILTENEENRKFILEDWLKYSDTRYSIWYILVLHQKYALYQYMNDVANKNTLGNLREFQKKPSLFLRKRRFKPLISRRPAITAAWHSG